MRLKISRSKNAASLYMIKSTYENGKHSTKIVEKLGTIADLEKKLNGRDPIEWAEEYIAEKTKEEALEKHEVITKFSNSRRIAKGKQSAYNGGYLFLQDLYYGLKLKKICDQISSRHKFEYDLNAIMSRLIYTRILYPSSKKSSFEASHKFIEKPDFDQHQIYRALDVIEEEKDFIEAQLYENSLKLSKRNTKVLFYDCTNFHFEIEQELGIKKYGKSKQHQPSPLVQMGLFMDGDGIPLAMTIDPGNKQEQTTLKPIEKRILKDFNLSQVIVCTDAGLASASNRKFNDRPNRAYITTQSLKKIKSHLKEWSLEPTGFKLALTEAEKVKRNELEKTTGRKVKEEFFDLRKVDPDKYFHRTFYKQRAINDYDIEENLIVTFSFKYQNYQRKIRTQQIERAENLIKTNSPKIKKSNPNDPKRFIEKINIETGEADEKCVYRINDELVEQEAMYDGFYGVCTNLEGDGDDVAEINRRRWEIEECFRIMKTDFKARPTHVRNDNRIVAHFTTCFMALVLFRLLEKKLDGKYTVAEMLSGLRDMNFFRIAGEGYVPTYTRTDFTDALHDTFGFRTDTEIVDMKSMKKNIKKTKKISKG